MRVNGFRWNALKVRSVYAVSALFVLAIATPIDGARARRLYRSSKRKWLIDCHWQRGNILRISWNQEYSSQDGICFPTIYKGQLVRPTSKLWITKPVAA